MAIRKLNEAVSWCGGWSVFANNRLLERGRRPIACVIRGTIKIPQKCCNRYAVPLSPKWSQAAEAGSIPRPTLVIVRRFS